MGGGGKGRGSSRGGSRSRSSRPASRAGSRSRGGIHSHSRSHIGHRIGGCRKFGLSSRRRHRSYGGGRRIVIEHLTHMGRRPFTAAAQAGMTQAAKFPADISVQLKHSVVYPGNVVEGFATVKPRVPLTAGYFHIKLVVKEQVYEKGSLNSMVLYRQILVVQGRKELIPKYMLQTGLSALSPSLDENLEMKLLSLPSTGISPAEELQQARAGSPFVPPGTYQFPFAFQLPVELPGTMCSNQGTHTAEIVAFVKAKFVAIDDTLTQESTAYFDIVRPRPSGFLLAKQYIPFDSQSFLLHVFCCVDRGVFRATVGCADRVCLDRDSALAVDVKLDLQHAQQNVKSVQVSLMHQFIFTYRENSEPVKFDLLPMAQAPVSTSSLGCGQVHNLTFSVPLKPGLPPTQRSVTVSSVYIIQTTVSMEGIGTSGPFVFNAPIEVAATVDTDNVLQLADQPIAVVIERRANHVILEPSTMNCLFSYAPPPTADVPYLPFPGAAPPLAAIAAGVDPRTEAALPMLNADPNSLPPLFPQHPPPLGFNAAWSQITFPDAGLWGPAFAEVAKEEAGGDEGINEGLAAITTHPYVEGEGFGSPL